MTLKCCVQTTGTEIGGWVVQLHRQNIQIEFCSIWPVSLESRWNVTHLLLICTIGRINQLHCLPRLLQIPVHSIVIIILTAFQSNVLIFSHHKTWSLGDFSSCKTEQKENTVKQVSHTLPAAEQILWLYWFLTCYEEEHCHTQSCPHPHSASGVSEPALYRTYLSPASPKPIADISVTATSKLKNKPLPARSQANTLFEVHVLKTHRKFQTDSSGRFSYSTNDNCGFIYPCISFFTFWYFVSRINQKMLSATK